MLRVPYSGPDCKLLLAFEVGTTYNGVSYSILEPGKEPEIQAIRKLSHRSDNDFMQLTLGYLRFAGQFLASGNTKIPPVVYSNRAVSGSTRTPALPFSKKVAEAQSDLLKYLNSCAEQHIQRVHPGIGTALWNGAKIHYILSHPNEWEGPQQSLMIQAAEMAGLIKGGRNRLSFITQGEATLNLYIDRGLMGNSISRGDGVVIVDAGEGTVDISAYVSPTGGGTFEEIARPQCHSEGSIFVTEAAGEYLYKLLKNSRFLRDLAKMKLYFEQTTRRAFSDPSITYDIHFDSVDTHDIQVSDQDVKLGISRGHLLLDGKHIASFFEPSIKCIVSAVLSLCQKARKPISTVLLVGSFSASDYVFRRMKESLQPHRLQVLRPHTQTNELVTDGAILSVLKNPNRTPIATTIDVTLSQLPLRSPAVTTIDIKPSQPPLRTCPPVVTTAAAAPSQPPPLTTPSSRFDKLTDDNYYEWKIYMTAHLVREGLLGVVDGTESHPGGAQGSKQTKKFTNKKARARAELILHVSPSQLVHCSSDDPVLIWNALAAVHTAQRRATINSLSRQLHKLHLEDDETMSAFIGRARRLGFLVNEAGGDISDGDLIVSITAGLPSSYDSCISFLDTLPDTDYNIAAISARLVAEYNWQNTSPQSTNP